MRKLSMLLVPGLVSMALAAGPVLTERLRRGQRRALAAEVGQLDQEGEEEELLRSAIPNSSPAYRTAYTTIYDNHDYTGAIGQLKSLKRDDVADVANLIGYSYRKLGDYQSSKVYYELALKDDPNHVRTWQYYGLLAARAGQPRTGAASSEQDRLARRHRQREYRSLAAALDKPTGATLVY